jgi:alkylation response protein AidB-like acyl-CoA dehydrogenase
VNFALSDEQEFLREAARGALGRVNTVEAARAALDGGELPDLWPTAVEAGWTGLLIREQHGGAGLGAIDAMLVFGELGRVLASVPLLGHVPATLLMDAGAPAEEVEPLADGSRRACLVPARPPSALEEAWTCDPLDGFGRAPAPAVEGGRVTGSVSWVPDAPGADTFVVVCGGGRVAVVEAADAEVVPVAGYDATRSLGHVGFADAPATELELPDGPAAAAFHLAGALLGAEAVGAMEVALERSVQYAKERFTFGRAIGSYQAVKHELVEILRRLENARSLMYYAGWAGADRPEEFAVAASAFRLVADEGLDHASRAQISVHGGIGATWEHDAPLYYRRAQLSRRLLGGAALAADRVADELFAQARAAGAA